MSIIDVKTRVIDSRQVSQVYSDGTIFDPMNSFSTTTITLPADKFSVKAFTGMKLQWGMFYAIDSLILIDQYANGLIVIEAQDATGATVSGNVVFNSLILPLPQANPNVAPPVNIASNADFAQMLQSTINARIGAIAPLQVAMGGVNPIAVAWLPRVAIAGSIGNFVFSNIYFRNFRLNFVTPIIYVGGAPVLTGNNMGNLLGFGPAVTDWAVSVMSPSTVVDFATIVPTTGTQFLAIVADDLMSGIDNGVLNLNGAESPKNLLSVIPVSQIGPANSRYYRERINVSYTVVINSVVYYRIKYGIFGPWGTRPPPTAQQPPADNPYFRVRFIGTNGYPASSTRELYSVLASPAEATMLSYSFIYNEPTEGARRLA